MKIALAFVGKPRPNYDFCFNNIQLTKNILSKHEVDSYILLEKEDYHDRYSQLLDNIILTKYLDDATIENKFGFNATIGIARPPKGTYVKNNLFRQFYKNNILFKYIVESKIQYDYIFWQRIDFNLDFNPDLFFNKGKYTTIAWNPHGHMETDDRMGVAEPDIMVKAWDYHDIDNFNKITNESFNPEDFLRRLTKANDIEWHWADYKSLKLKEHPEYRGKE